MPRRISFSRTAVCDAASCARACASSFFRRLFSLFASNASPTKLNRSRNGLAAVLAPFSIGDSTCWAPRWMPCRTPPPGSPKYAVRSTSDSSTSAPNTARRRRMTFLSYTRQPPRRAVRMERVEGTSVPAAASGVVAVRAVDRLELLERAPGADRHARERRLGQVRRHLGLVAQALVEPLEQRAAAGHHDPAVHDVGRELRRRAVERLLDRVDDRLERLLERLPHLLAREHDGLGQARYEVAAADLGLHLLAERERRADLELDLLGGLLTDHQLVLALDVVDDRLVELVAADPDRLRDDDAAERDDRDLGGAAADVDDHVAGGLADGQARADRRRHGLLDEVGGARPGRQAGLLDRAL